MKRYDVFYKNLEISDEDKRRSEKNLFSKGVKVHQLIKDKLASYSEDGTVKYTQVASAYRYDKRIRLVLFKYISYLEEFYRGILLDNYTAHNQRFWTEPIKGHFEEFKYDLVKTLERAEFSDLLWQMTRVGKKLRKAYNLDFGSNTSTNFKALRELRNAVMHNKFLLLYRGFEECVIDKQNKEKDASLRANIINLINHLPPAVGENCRRDIEKCMENRNEGDETEWDLPDFVTIQL